MDLPSPTQVRTRQALYALVGFGLTVAYGMMRGVPWQGSDALHTVMETAATLLALVVGAMALVRYYSRKDSMFLIIGAGFLGTGFLDGYHAVVTSAFFRPFMPSDLPALIPWSWVASRLFLSVMMVASWLVWLRERKLGEEGRFSEAAVYLVTALCTLAAFLFFAFFPLPRAYYPELSFHRPEEFLPALFFLAALAGYLGKGRWKDDPFEHWLVLSLIVGFVSQAVFMSFSGHLFDFEFDAAHLLKKVGYVCVLTGLFLSMYVSFVRERQVRRELSDKEELLTLAMDNLPGALVVTDRDLNVVLSSRQFADTYQVPPHLLAAGGDYRLFLRHLAESGYYGDGDVEAMVAERVASILNPGAERFEDRRPDGRVFGVRRNPIDAGLTVTTVSDITELKQRQQELLESEARLQAINDAVPAGILVARIEDGVIIFANAEAQRILDVSVGDLFGRNWNDIFSDSGDKEEMLVRFSAAGVVRNQEMRIRRSGGGENWVYMSLTGVPSDDETMLLMSFIDISKRKQAERELEVAKEEAETANQTKSDFLASMSHEIRTPMAGIKGFADMLLEDSIPEESREKVFRIKESLDGLLGLLNEILDLSKLEAGKMELEYIDFHLPSLVNDAAALFRSNMTDGKVELAATLSEDFPQGINADPTRIRQILLNLIGNAIKFTELGTVTVSGSRAQSGDGGPMFRIAVTDTGVGLKPGSVEKLFKEFTQADSSISRKYQGSGLGLSISKRLVELMGGEIGVESEYQKGSTFWFTLPYGEAASDVSARPGGVASTVLRYRAQRPLRVLIVDDNAMNQRIIVGAVESYGHQTDVAKDGMLGIEKHERDDFDLILMDVRMPVLSGPDATELIRGMDKDKRDIPIIALTADAMADHKRQYLAAGMDAVVGKPIDREELALTINRVMGEEIHRPVEEIVSDPAPSAPAADPGGDGEDEDIARLLERMQAVADSVDAPQEGQ